MPGSQKSVAQEHVSVMFGVAGYLPQYWHSCAPVAFSGYMCLVILSKTVAHAFCGEAWGAGVLLGLVPEVLQILGSVWTHSTCTSCISSSWRDLANDWEQNSLSCMSRLQLMFIVCIRYWFHSIWKTLPTSISFSSLKFRFYQWFMNTEFNPPLKSFCSLNLVFKSSGDWPNGFFSFGHRDAIFFYVP